MKGHAREPMKERQKAKLAWEGANTKERKYVQILGWSGIE